MVDKLADLVGLDGDEPLVAAVLAVLLLEDDAGDAPALTLLGGDALAGAEPRDRHDGLGVLGVGPREGLRLRFVDDGSGGRRLAVAPEVEGL